MKRREFLVLPLLAACKGSREEPGAARGALPWPPERAVSSADLAAQLTAPEVQRPRVAHVGPKRLFQSGHVPGAAYVGEAGERDGLAALERWLSPLPRDANVVVYCGCCPYKNCPNIRPAYDKAVAMGFTRVRVLDLPTTFKADWADHGLPVERG